jgi:hypothetical protein
MRCGRSSRPSNETLPPQMRAKNPDAGDVWLWVARWRTTPPLSRCITSPTTSLRSTVRCGPRQPWLLESRIDRGKCPTWLPCLKLRKDLRSQPSIQAARRRWNTSHFDGTVESHRFLGPSHANARLLFQPGVKEGTTCFAKSASGYSTCIMPFLTKMPRTPPP